MKHIHQSIASISLSILGGSVGGITAKFLGAPMPFLLGAFILMATLAVMNVRVFGVAPSLPLPLRSVFVGIIGMMIGGSVQPGIFAAFGDFYVPVLGVFVFVLFALAMNYVMFRKIGGYDKPTAFYAAMPGGLIESIALGEKAGGDAQILSLQQFARIALVITTVPFLFVLFTGTKVGSAAGASLNLTQDSIELKDWSIMAVCVIAGLLGGKAIRLPASILTGPMLLSGLAHYTGILEVGPPGWMIAGAQVIVGAGLGARFQGFKPQLILRVFLLAVLSVGGMLLLGVALSLILINIIDQPFGVLFISFAPGGVTETALIALSLDANPVFVTMLHIIRIVFTVVVSGLGRFVIRTGV